jgi:hypothetical protein
MKEKIIARLKAKFPGVNLSKKRLDAIADKLAKKVEKEEDIDEALDEANELMDFAQVAKDDDRVRTLEAEAKKPKQEPKKEDSSDGKEPAKGEEIPAWAKGLVDTNKQLLEKVTLLETGKTTDLRKQKLEETLKEINPKLKEKALRDFSRMKFDTDEDFETYLQETVTDLGDFKGDNSEQPKGGVSFSKPNLGGGTAPAKAAMKKGIEEWAKQNEPLKAN